MCGEYGSKARSCQAQGLGEEAFASSRNVAQRSWWQADCSGVLLAHLLGGTLCSVCSMALRRALNLQCFALNFVQQSASGSGSMSDRFKGSSTNHSSGQKSKFDFPVWIGSSGLQSFSSA